MHESLTNLVQVFVESSHVFDSSILIDILHVDKFPRVLKIVNTTFRKLIKHETSIHQ